MKLCDLCCRREGLKSVQMHESLNVNEGIRYVYLSPTGGTLGYVGVCGVHVHGVSGSMWGTWGYVGVRGVHGVHVHGFMGVRGVHGGMWGYVGVRVPLQECTENLNEFQ